MPGQGVYILASPQGPGCVMLNGFDHDKSSTIYYLRDDTTIWCGDGDGECDGDHLISVDSVRQGTVMPVNHEENDSTYSTHLGPLFANRKPNIAIFGAEFL
ncbi:hypothetical protein SCAR479_12659 [Seiridium cardinale]|uniref:Uncharacterized protein n=1 Tax=Seiridium cardinale TaxID=138064 RepID=A0ABR2XA60_9PEZI